MRTFATTVIALTLWWIGAGVASAHTGLVSSDPSADATVAMSPSVITLTFNEEIKPTFATVVVNSADGRNWIVGSPRVEGPRITATIGSNRPTSGVYTVGYRVVSADGHPVSGSYKFTIAGAPAGPQPPIATSSAAAPATTAAPQSPAAAGTDTKTSILGAGGAGLVLGGAIALWQTWRRRRARTTLTGSESTSLLDPDHEPKKPPAD